MTTSFREVGRNTAFYGISRVASRVASLLLLPIYTRALSPADYGLLALLEIATEVITIAFVAGTRSGMLRFYFESKDEKQRQRVVSTTFLMEGARAFIGAGVLALIAPLVWRFGLDEVGTPTLIRLAALRFALAILSDAPNSLMQAQGKAGLSTLIVLARLLMQIACNLFFLLVLRLGATGMVLSGVVVNAAVAIFTIGWLRRQMVFQYDRAIGRRLRRYGAPYQVTMAGAFILTFGDRFILQQFRDATSVGLYAFAYQFGFLLLELGPSPFMRAWLPERYRALQQSTEARQRMTRLGFLILNGVSLTAATAIIVGARPVFRLLAAPAYQSAAAIVPVVVLAYLFHIWNDVAKFGIDAAGRGVYYTYSSWIATGIVLGGYLLLIPPFGGMGAAFATLMAFAVRFSLTYHWSQRFTPLEYGWHRVARIAALASVASLTGILFRPDGLALQLTTACCLIVFLVLAIWQFVASATERAMLRAMVSTTLAGIRTRWRHI